MHGGIGFGTLKRDFLERNRLPLDLQDRFYEGLLRLREIPVTIALGSHPGHIHMLERYAAKNGKENPFIDPSVWPSFMNERAEAFNTEILQPERIGG